MNEGINLCKILKDCPKGVEFWSPLLDTCALHKVDDIMVTVTNPSGSWNIASDATLTIKGNKSVEPMLYPSRTQRDWSKWECPQKSKKPKFDPKTLKPFDKVVVKGRFYTWKCGLFSHIDNLGDADDDEFKYICIGSDYAYCIPYNDDTKHLVGTLDEAPEYYRYWED